MTTGGAPSIRYKTLTIYEDEDDFGANPTYKSKTFGSTGPRIACCTIYPKRFKNDIDDFTIGRGLQSTIDIGDELISQDDLRELFDFTPATSSDFDQN